MSKTRVQERLLEAMTEATKKHGDTIIEKVIPFRNNDVPEFLEKLDNFERESRKRSITITSYCTQAHYSSKAA
ncbi:MAG: hypothetical protein AABX29_06555 [Nanoarchaeota archaeon]